MSPKAPRLIVRVLGFGPSSPAIPCHWQAQTNATAAADIVTETDRAVEAHIRSRLLAAHPTFNFIGAETYERGTPVISAENPAPAFVVDPIDGTTNFVHGFPWACVSLALVLPPDARPAVGVVYNPFLGLEYSGVHGGGSFVRQTKVPGSPKQRLPLRQSAEPLDDLSRALVTVEWGSERSGPNFDVKLATFRALGAHQSLGGAMVHSMRCLGSAALNICTVAAGQTDIYWEGGCWAWDVAAAWVILEEAGGRMFGGNPDMWDVRIESRLYLAVRQIEGGKEKQEDIVRQFWACMGGGTLFYEH